MDIIFIYQSLILLIYSTLKAFLPLPSLEVILIPLILKYPSKWLFLALLGSVGTFIGGGIGYYIALKQGRKVLSHLVSQNDLIKSEHLMEKHGILAVFIGGITPIPDFLLPYLAGFTRMSFISFALCDSISRFIRSILVTWTILAFGTVIDLESFGNYFLIFIFTYFTIKWLISKYKTKKNPINL